MNVQLDSSICALQFACDDQKAFARREKARSRCAGDNQEGISAGKPGDMETESQQGRDLLSTGIQKASSHITPSKDALAGIDQAGPQHQFVSKGGRKVGPGETPILKGRQ
ncbi:hypothetical protein DXG01_006682 [Tephrocybe rancida]|nr:hypothetical protein DXG01_006682 [Tephrocybe rancida]